MESIVFLIIIAIVIVNLNKQAKLNQKQRQGGANMPGQPPAPRGSAQPGGRSIPPNGRPFAPSGSASRRPFAPVKPAADAPAYAPRDVDSTPLGSAEQGSLSGQQLMMDDPGQNSKGSLEGQPMIMDDPGQDSKGSLYGQPTMMDEGTGSGSLPDTGSEGREFHGDSAHSDAAMGARYSESPDAYSAPDDLGAARPGGPGDLMNRAPLASRLVSGEDSLDFDDIPGAMTGESGFGAGEGAPELMGMKLDAEAMRRAVVVSEILNKRGGRHGWVRT